MFSDYHTHTLYSNHGQGHPLEVAKEAVERGLVALGFSEHFPMPQNFTKADPTDGTANMHWDQIDSYIREVREAQAEYGNKIKILLGYEVDYLPSDDAEMKLNLAKYPADYYVGSIHVVDRFRSNHLHWVIDYTTQTFEEGLSENGGAVGVYTRYYQLVRDYAKSFNHQIVGHLDLIKKFNEAKRFFDTDSQEYLNQVEATLDVLKATGKIIEVNTAGQFKSLSESYPSDKVLQMILERQIPICLSSDAHHPTHVGRGFSATWERLTKMGFEQLTSL